MSDGLKILQVGPLPPPVGGMATVVTDLVAELGSRHEVHVINVSKTTADDRALWQGVLAQLKLLLALAGQCVFWRPQIVHIHTCSQGTFWRSSVDVLLARLLGRRVVLHIHGGAFHHFLESLSGIRARWARSVFRLSHCVVVLGQEWKNILAPWCPAGRVDVVPNGVPVPDAYSRNRAQILHVLCLANYAENKGQSDLVRAVAGLDSVHLTLAGFESEKGQKQALLDLAAELGIAERVFLPGPVTGEEKARYYRDADVFCLPSFNEGLPMSMLEAMAEGLPVVVTRVGAIPELVIDGENGLLVEPGRVAQLTQALRRLLDDPVFSAQIAARARSLVVESYSITRAGQRLDALYRRLL